MFHTVDMNVVVSIVRVSSGVMVAVRVVMTLLICLLAAKDYVQL